MAILFRDEDKLSRKLIECINKFLLKDGPNLGCHAMEIHSAVQQFVFRCWLTTHDRAVKVSQSIILRNFVIFLKLNNCCYGYHEFNFLSQDALILYARLQLNLTRDAADGSLLVEQLFDIVCKELDQSFSSGGGVPWLVVYFSFLFLYFILFYFFDFEF